MRRFGKKTKVSQEIPTSALPDIIFILLFFFMVATKIKKTDLKVDTLIPKAESTKKIDESMERVDLYIGYPMDKATYGSEPVVQAGSDFVSPQEVKFYISKVLGGLPEGKNSPNNLLIYINGDEEVGMGVVTDVKQELRKIGVRNVNYATIKKKL